MGFRLSSFIAGAAERLTDTLKEDEKQAATAATFGVKALKENYDKVQAENRTLENEVSKNIDVLRTFDKTATEAEIFAAATNKTFMSMAVEAAKTNPAGFKLSEFVKIKEENASPLTAMERYKEQMRLPTVSADEQQKTTTAVPEKSEGLFGFGTMRNRAASRAASKAEEQTAKAMGVSIEQLRAASGFKRPEIDAGATFDFTSMQKTKTFDERENDAKVKLLDAQRKGDVDAIKLAQADLLIIDNIKQSLTPTQTQFANKVADIKKRYMFGTSEEREAAKPDYDKLMSDIRAEAMAKKVTKEEDEKIPALSILNTFTSAAVVRAVSAKYGDLVKSKQLAIVEKADGSLSIDYIGMDNDLRRQILQTQADAAKNALALYTDAEGKPFNRDVASVLNSFTSIVPSSPPVKPAAVAPAASVAPKTAPPVKPAAAAPITPVTPADVNRIRAEGNAAIADGAPADVVAKRFKEVTREEF